MPKKYLLFAGDFYYPSGGMSDFIASFNTLEEAENKFKDGSDIWPFDWWQIVDRDTLKIIKTNREPL